MVRSEFATGFCPYVLLGDDLSMSPVLARRSRRELNYEQSTGNRPGTFGFIEIQPNKNCRSLQPVLS
jgi:hypothetical protein